MSKRLRELFILAKLWTFKIGHFCQGGSGKWFILRELPHPTCAIWRQFVSMTLRRDTCWRHVLITERHTKGKVKPGLRCFREMFSRFSWSPRTRLQYLKINSASFYIEMSKEPNTQKCGSSKKRQFRGAPKGAAGVRPGSMGFFFFFYYRVTTSTPFCQEQKNGLLAKIFRISGLIQQRWKL